MDGCNGWGGGEWGGEGFFQPKDWLSPSFGEKLKICHHLRVHEALKQGFEIEGFIFIPHQGDSRGREEPCEIRQLHKY